LPPFLRQLQHFYHLPKISGNQKSRLPCLQKRSAREHGFVIFKNFSISSAVIYRNNTGFQDLSLFKILRGMLLNPSEHPNFIDIIIGNTLKPDCNHPFEDFRTFRCVPDFGFEITERSQIFFLQGSIFHFSKINLAVLIGCFISGLIVTHGLQWSTQKIPAPARFRGAKHDYITVRKSAEVKK